ncbi:MAG: T9SS type A sorting domain-containing protein [Bacteroidia bacterium]|nr:T9SS type A sorting domain-containing protein [Bacteroidia bacterium]
MLKRFYIAAIFLIYFAEPGYSQSLIGSCGLSGENSGFGLSWSVGEPATYTLSDTGSILTQGFHQLGQHDIQNILLPQGWSIFSTYIYPSLPTVSYILGSLNHIVLAKDGEGNIFWNAYGIDNIGILTIGKGYYIKMLQQENLVINGIAAIPQYVAVNIPSGWSIAGYLRNSSAPISQMLSSIVSYVVIVKNGSGNVFWPGYGVNNIVNMIPGEGYLLKATSPVSFYYPVNSSSMMKSLEFNSCIHFLTRLNTGNNMTLCIPEYAWPVKPENGYEIGITGDNGQLVGSAVYNGGNTAITIWGVDHYLAESPGLPDGKSFSIKKWSKATGEEELFDVELWREGSNKFETNGLCVVEKLKARVAEEYLTVSPNPSKDKTSLEYKLNKPGRVQIEVYDSGGKSVYSFTDENTSVLKQKHELDLSGFAPGKYLIRVLSDDRKLSGNLTIVR